MQQKKQAKMINKIFESKREESGPRSAGFVDPALFKPMDNEYSND